MQLHGIHHLTAVTADARGVRHWFRSPCAREPNGILCEIATDGPGFATDDPPEALGERLVLPPFLEPRRADIEGKLAQF